MINSQRTTWVFKPSPLARLQSYNILPALFLPQFCLPLVPSLEKCAILLYYIRDNFPDLEKAIIIIHKQTNKQANGTNMRVAIFFILLLGSVGAMVPSVEEVTSGMEIESGGAKIYCALEGCQREMEKESLIFAKCPDHIACERCARHFICSEKLNAPHRFVCPRWKKEQDSHHSRDPSIIGTCPRKVMRCKNCARYINR
jgi:hypothetical protein